MNSCVVFETPTTLDLKALTIMGINAKPQTESPIGYFGTGLKYAIAVLVREGANVALVTDGKCYTFGINVIDFRGEDINSIEMNQVPDLSTFIMMPDPEIATWDKAVAEMASTVNTLILPFTTQLGKNWSLWQALRELESNTRDEQGESYIRDLPETGEQLEFSSLSTYFIVQDADFVDEYERLDNIFLPKATTKLNSEGDEYLEYFPVESDYLYYRGVRIMDLDKPSAVTYNLLERVELTEDRTAKYEYWLRDRIRDYIIRTQDKTLIQHVITADAGSFEARLDFANATDIPSDEFKETLNTLYEHPDSKDSLLPAVVQFSQRTSRRENPVYRYPWLKDLFDEIHDYDEVDFEMFCDALRPHKKTVLELLETCAEAKESIY